MNTPGTSQLSLQDQLYCYAQDLSELMDQHAKLQQRYLAAQQSLGHSHLNHDLLPDCIREGENAYLITDSAGIITHFSPATEALLGEPGLDWRGLPIAQLAPMYQRANLSMVLTDFLRPYCNAAIEQRRFELFDGRTSDSVSSFDVLVVPLRSPGQLEFFWILNLHSPESTDDMDALQQFHLLQDSCHGLLVANANRCVIALNPAVSEITGYAAHELLGSNPRLLSSGRHDRLFFEAFWEQLESTGSWTGEFFNRRKNGQIYPEQKTVKVVKNASGVTVAYLSVGADTSRVPDTAQLSHLAYHDTLTGLPNRRLFDDRLAQSLNVAQRDDSGFSLLFIDLDRFKPINDKLGHEVGDVVLKEVSLRLKKSVRQGDFAARVGGDEFVILLPHAVRTEDVQSIGNIVLSNLSQPIQAGEHHLLIGASIGCARYPVDGLDSAALLKHADSAMYAAKRFGGNHFCFFESTGDPKMVANLGLDLWLALTRDELHLLYQPQVTVAGELCGCEALVRWNHPTFGLLAPLTFIPIAEANGAIIPIGDWVLDTACCQLKQWQQGGLERITLSVNVSARQLQDPHFVERVRLTLLRHGIAPGDLELEITEADALKLHVDGQQCLQPLRALGVKLVIEDFGSGCSSLSRLTTLPVDRLKMDQSFVRDLATSPKAQAISQCFISMGLAMGMEVVAEGVETLAQHQLLVDQGCSLIQGYLTGRPMTASAFLTCFHASSPLRAAEANI